MKRFPFACALVAFVIHAIANPHYGFFRDELYFIICGFHPAWGYVDQPPVVPLLAAGSQLFGHSLFMLRLVAAFFSAASIYVTCLLAEEMGGGIFAQLVGALVAFFAGVLMNFGMKVSPDTVGLWLWPLAALYTLRIVKGADPRWWLAVGLAIGISLESKYSAIFFAIALVIGLLLVPERSVLRSRWFFAGAALALVIALPNFLWQALHGFPMWELLRNGQNGKNVIVGPLLFLAQEVLITNLFLAIVWIAGLVWLFLAKQLRFLGFTYVVLILMMIALRAKHYYPADVYPILMAAGGVAIENWTRLLTIARIPIAAAIVAGGVFLLPMDLPVLSEPAFISYSHEVGALLHINRDAIATEHHREDSTLPGDYADMHGWPEMAAEIQRVFNSLPPDERANAVVYVQNYGEASAVEFFAPSVPVVSGHNQYYLWGTHGYTARTLIDVNGPCLKSLHVYQSAQHVATFSAPYAIDYENNIPIDVCRGQEKPLASVWPTLKSFE